MLTGPIVSNGVDVLMSSSKISSSVIKTIFVTVVGVILILSKMFLSLSLFLLSIRLLLILR